MCVIKVLLMKIKRSSNVPRILGNSQNFSSLVFVPKCEPANDNDLSRLEDYLKNTGNICVLTGAGISTESGIPDYRSQGVGLYATSSTRPTLYQDFCKSEQVRRRYWTRNYIGWPRFSSVQPNVTHRTLKYLEDIGLVTGIVTQNVDGLHTKAGSKNIIELHGTGFKVMCLNCDNKIDRKLLQIKLDKLNSSIKHVSKIIRPDGDVELSNEIVNDFILPPCENCGGILKPDIVFFGDNVAKKVVDSVRNIVTKSDGLLVLGTSLTTFSGYRIILQAIEENKKVAIVNIGETRADKHASVKLESRCGEVLKKLYPNIQFDNNSNQHF